MTTLASRASALDTLAPLKAWWPIVLGLVVLYVPTYWMLAHGIWNSDEQAHGPIVLVVALFLIWQQRAVFMDDASVPPTRGEVATGWTLLIVGLLAYALGRSQDILLFEIGSQVPVILGALLITMGVRAVRALWFALFFLLFMIPLPGFVVDAATGPLKQYISIIANRCCMRRVTPLRAAVSRSPSGHTSCWWPTPAPACTPCSACRPWACCISI